MKLEYILFNMIAAAGLFFLNGLLGKLQYGMNDGLFEYGKFSFDSRKGENFSGNFFYKIVNPAVYLAAAAAVMQYLVPTEFIASMWLLIPFFWIYRLIFIIVKNLFVFLNIKYEVIALALSLLLGETVFFKIILPLLTQCQSIWIPATELRDALWFAILTYLAKVTWDIMRRSFSQENLYPKKKLQDLIEKRYDKFNRKYGSYIASQISQRYDGRLNPDEQNCLSHLLYAIMIYEDYNRPFLIRQAERLCKATVFRHRAMTLGIMQFRAYHIITDEESISYAIDYIAQPFLRKTNCPVETAINMYNNSPDYFDEVIAIYDALMRESTDKGEPCG